MKQETFHATAHLVFLVKSSFKYWIFQDSITLTMIECLPLMLVLYEALFKLAYKDQDPS